MTTKAKIILISSGVIVAGGTFYFLYWRTRSAVKPSDMQVLQQYRASLTASVPGQAQQSPSTAVTYPQLIGGPATPQFIV